MRPLYTDKYATYASPEMISNRKGVLAHALQDAVDRPHPSHIPFTPYPKVIYNPYPIVFILNGVATIGKNEFVDVMVEQSSDKEVIHLSTIDPVRDVVKHLLQLNDQYQGFFTDCTPSETVITKKNDEYRDFLFNVKESWEKYDHGATTYSIGNIMRAIYDDTDKMCRAIFIDSRETETINRITSAMNSVGIITMKILICGNRSTTADWKNGCDHNICTDESFYDVVVHNDGNLERLKLSACSFWITLNNILDTYGISRDGACGDTTITK